MTRLILAALFPVALLTTAVAAPGEREVSPASRPAPPPFLRAAPKINDSLELVILTETGPIRMRVTIQIDGQSLSQAWQTRLKTAFDYFDQNADGSLNTSEAARVFPERFLAQHISGGILEHQKPPTLADLDTDRDGKVSFEEFQAYYVCSARLLSQPQTVEGDITANEIMSERLIKRFDTNRDGRLTKEELSTLEQLVATHDADEDECFNFEELESALEKVEIQGRAPSKPPDSGPVIFLFVADKPPPTLTMQTIKKYDRNNDRELSQAEGGFDDVTFRALDKDGSCKVSPSELYRSPPPPADIDLTLSWSRKGKECSARLTDSASGRRLGVRAQQIESGRLVLEFRDQRIEFQAKPRNSVLPPTSEGKTAFLSPFSDGQEELSKQEAQDLLGSFFSLVDRNGDGKVTRSEFNAYVDLLDSFRDLSFGLTRRIHMPTVFELLDQNRDGVLSVRELRTAWTRLIALEKPGATAISKNIIRQGMSVQLSPSPEPTKAHSPPPDGFQISDRQSDPQRGPTWFRKMDRNADGDVSRSEFVGTVAEFDAIDTDLDGLISLEEAEEWDRKHRGKDTAGKK